MTLTLGIVQEINADVAVSLPAMEGGCTVSVKFHHWPIDEVVAYEREHGLVEVPPPGVLGAAAATPEH